MSDENQSALAARPEWLADPKTYFSAGLLELMDKHGWGDEKIRYLIDHPTEALAFRSDMETSIKTFLPLVWEVMAKKAIEGTTADRIAFLRRFDEDFKEGAQRGLMLDDELPDKETFLRMMRIKYGAEEVGALLTLADNAGEKGGGFGEEFLDGGKFEDETPETKDPEVETNIFGEPT